MSTDDEIADHCWNRRSHLVYKVRVTILYHLLRERFFDSIDKAVSIVTAVAATAAVADVLNTTKTGQSIAAVVTAILSVVPLVFAPAAMAKKHGDLASSFRQLLAEFYRSGEHWSVDQCDEFASKMAELEFTEPAPLTGLVAHCQNQLAGAFNAKPPANVRWYHRMFMHFIDMTPDRN